ncbi:MAG: flagellar M-ring protein FliF [Lachnospiraceae bacterium]|nr:flagellar M-ring protein FliF [Lachnospiraceae bacterium]
MPEQVQKFITPVLEWWNKFTSRQKTFIIAISAGIIMTMAILLTLLNQTQYVHLTVAASPAEASEIRDLLAAEGNIKYKQSADSLRFEVDRKQHINATMLLASNNIQSDVWSIDNVTTGGFSTTEADKQRRYKVYLENHISRTAAAMNGVRTASTTLNMPYNDGTLLSQHRESSASVLLDLNGDFGEEQAANLAKIISVGLGSSTPLNISIMDTNGNMLFSGDDIHSSTGGSANNQLSTKNKAEAVLNSEIRNILQGTDEFARIVVASNLVMNFARSRSVDTEYYVADGREEGFILHESHYDSESTNQGGGVPGTDSNTEGGPSYQWPDHHYSSMTESERSIDRLVSNVITESDFPGGHVVYAESSVAVTAVSHNIIREEDARRQGLLDGISWDEYKDFNSERTILTIDDEMRSIVSNASGIPLSNITIRAYAENIFLDAERMQVAWTDVTQIFLIVIILGLLAFVVIRSMRYGREEVEEEELSVERLLQSQPELEDISIDEGSESKKIIDKFVEDNPEAAASLLRNWLNEDWG